MRENENDKMTFDQAVRREAASAIRNRRNQNLEDPRMCEAVNALADSLVADRSPKLPSEVTEAIEEAARIAESIYQYDINYERIGQRIATKIRESIRGKVELHNLTIHESIYGEGYRASCSCGWQGNWNYSRDLAVGRGHSHALRYE